MGGITAAGFDRETFETILNGIQSDELRPISEGGIDPAFDLSTSEPIGQVNGLFADRLSDLWELLEMVYHGFDEAAVEGDMLEALCAISGTLRRAAKKSEHLQEFNLTIGTVVPAGFLVRVPGDPLRSFELIEEFTAPASLGYELRVRALTAGPVFVPAFQVTEIVTPLAGVNFTENSTDVDGGSAIETDDELRLRRTLELQRQGQNTVDALRSELVGLDGVISVFVFENIHSVVDADGMPPHSVEVMVHDGSTPVVPNNTIAQIIWDNKAAGTKTWGTSTGIAVDKEGVNRTVRFSRPVQRNIYVDIFATRVTGVGAPAVPGTATTLLRSHLVTEANKLATPGADVLAIALRAIVYESRTSKGYTWLYDVQNLELGFAAAPSGTANLVISPREIANFDTGNTSAVLL